MNENLNWGRAKGHLKQIRQLYTDIGASGLLALQGTINPLLIRLEKNERAQDLYESIMNLE